MAQLTDSLNVLIAHAEGTQPHAVGVDGQHAPTCPVCKALAVIRSQAPVTIVPSKIPMGGGMVFDLNTLKFGT